MFQTEVLEKIQTHFTLHNFSPENRTVNEIRWRNNLQPDRRQMKIWNMHFAIDTHSAYVILIDFPRLKWLRETH
jgi:hypothetical protein